MYHAPNDSRVPQYNYNSYREGRRSTPSYALIPHNPNSNRRVQYTTTRYHTEPTRYHTETQYHSGTTRYHSEPRIYQDSRDHIDTYQEQRYVIPYNSNTHRTSHISRHHDGQWVAPARYDRYGQTSRGYKYRRKVVEQPIPVCACVIM